MYVALYAFPAPCSSPRRLSMVSTPPVLVSGNAYASSEPYAAPGRSYRPLTPSQRRFWLSVVSRSPQRANAMFTKGHSTVQGCASNASECIPKTVWRIPQKSLIPLFSRLPPLMRPTDALSGGRSMETLGAPKYRPLPRYHFHPSPTYFRMDAQRQPKGVHPEAPRRRPA